MIMNTRDIDFTKFKDKFDREVVKVMRNLKVPGISILITQDKKPLYQRCFGVREKGDVKATTPNTLFGISSITKSITCLGVLQLQEAGLLNIDDPISKYIPVKIGLESDPIKIRHLMSHASGIPSLMTFYFSQMNQDLYQANAPIFPMGNWDDFYFHINDAQSEILSSPNKKYYYFNAGFVLLGQLIEKLSKQPFEEYITEKILQPLGMNRSTFFRKTAEEDEDISRGFNFGLQDKKIKRAPKNLLSGPFISGSGGLISSAKEITNFLQCHIDGGEFNGNRILEESLIKEMWQSHNNNIQAQYLNYYPNSNAAYGYGWKIHENFFGHRLYVHGGMSGVSGGWVGFIPELNLTYAQLQNVNWTPEHLILTAFALLLGKDPDEDMPLYKRRKHYRVLSGKYEAYKKTITMEIQSRNGLLFLTDENWFDKHSTPLIPKNDKPEVMDFYVITEYGKMDVPFTKHDDGEITFDWERHILHKKTIELEED